MSNPNPSVKFKPGNNGRPKEARDRVTKRFLLELADDFDEHGKVAIVKLRETDVGRYIGAIVALVPKEVNLNAQPLDGIEDSKLTEAIETLTAALLAKVPPPPAEPEEPRVIQ